MNILLLEDNEAIASSLGEYLDAKHCSVDYAYSGRSCLELAVQHNYDVLVLDIAMQGMDGLAVCRKIRAELQLNTPIIFLTARDTLEDKLLGFDAGGDDYLVKPFSPEELYCRLQALYARGPRRDIGLQTLGDLTINHAMQTVTRKNRSIKLAGVQFKILALLAKNSPNIVSRQKLEGSIWGDMPPDSHSLRTHMYRLRNQIDKPFAKPLITTVHGKGYRLEAI